jgi:maltooligosyltrehalose trehalohydrolase
MGQEWAATEPFLFFSDLGSDLGPLVSEGRRREFARFPEFAQAESREHIPDPQADTTRVRSVLRWDRVGAPPHADWLAFHRHLLEVRARDIAPLLRGEPVPETRLVPIGDTGLEVTWTFPDRRVLRLVANLGAQTLGHEGPAPGWGMPCCTMGTWLGFGRNSDWTFRCHLLRERHER